MMRIDYKYIVISLLSISLFFSGCASTTQSKQQTPTAGTNKVPANMNPNQAALLTSSGEPANTITPEGTLIAGTLSGVVAGTAAGTLTGNLWLIPAGSAAGALVGLGLAVVVSDQYAFPSFCDDDGNCEPIGFLQTEDKIARLLSTAGATVVDVGGNTVVIIPSRYLFIPGTADFKLHQPNLLNLAAKLAQKRNPDRIIIIGHVANIGLPEEQFKLTSTQANVVAHYLQHFYRLRNKPMLTLALGSAKPIASGYTTVGRGQNNAIIISMGDAQGLNYYRRFVLSPYQYGDVGTYSTALDQ